MTSRSGLVGHGEGARDLHHLALADGQVADLALGRSMPWPGKISSSLARISVAALRRFQPKPRRRSMNDAGILGDA